MRKTKTQQIVKEAMRIALKDVRIPQVIKDLKDKEKIITREASKSFEKNSPEFNAFILGAKSKSAQKFHDKWFKLPKDYKDITGVNNPDELQCYERGRELQEKVMIKFIEKWDGSTNSEMGQILSDKFKALSKNKG